MLGGLAFGAWTLWLMARSKGGTGAQVDPELAAEGRRFLERAGRG